MCSAVLLVLVVLAVLVVLLIVAVLLKAHVHRTDDIFTAIRIAEEFGLGLTLDHCTGTADDPFADALTHYNPQCCPHPAHAGDMPPLIANNGYAIQAFLTDRFTVREILGKTVIIHDSADDFSSQPAGNAGARIACGVIRKTDRC